MQVVDLPLEKLHPAPWNPNVMDEAMTARLRESLDRFGLVENLVVRPANDGGYEVLNGNQRLPLLRECGHTHSPCVIVAVDSAQARLLAMALNRIQGEDDMNLKAELVKKVLESVPQAEVLGLLPETAGSLEALARLGEGDLAEHLQKWQAAQATRLRHLQFQLTESQLETVEKALKRALVTASRDEANPNRRGNALYALCRDYLRRLGKERP